MDNETRSPGRLRRLGTSVGLTAVLIVGGAVPSFAATTAPDPGALAGTLVNGAGTSMLNAVIAVLPILVPFLVALWAIGFVWKKVRPKGGGIG